MPLLIAAAALIIGSVIGAGHKESVFKSDTTYKDTVAFEKNATEIAYRHVQAIELNKINSLKKQEERVTSSH